MTANSTGIVAQAANGAVLASKRFVEYRSLPSKSILNRCSSQRMSFRWTINPYRGCEIGCHYCYAVYTHKYLGLDDPRQFASLIFAKSEAKEILARELARGVVGPIAIGTGTDPYQPAERRFETTRGILEAFADSAGHRIGITTKSSLITRDIDLLQEIAKHNWLHVNITVTTADEDLARVLEPKASRPSQRFDVVGKLCSHNIKVGVFSAPVLPLLTDTTASLDAVARSASEAGAAYWTGHPLFLHREARERLMPFLKKQFPDIAARYAGHYRYNAYVTPEYRSWLAAKMDRIRKRHSLANAIEDWDTVESPAPEQSQPSLFPMLV